MIEQDTAREAAFQDAWEASFTRLGIEEDPYRIAQAFYRAAWAAGVAHGRAEALAAVANAYYEQAMLDPDSPTGTALFGKERAIRQAVYDVRAVRDARG